SYGDIESDMNSMAQHAVANGYGKIEYFRAHPIARSSRVTTTASASNESSAEVASRGRAVGIGFAMRGLLVYPAVQMLSKPCKHWMGELPTPRNGSGHAAGARPRAGGVPGRDGRAGGRVPACGGRDRRSGVAASRPRARLASVQRPELRGLAG